MPSSPKTASSTVRAIGGRSLRWKRAAKGRRARVGRNAGSWKAADAHLRAGKPVP